MDNKRYKSLPFKVFAAKWQHQKCYLCNRMMALSTKPPFPRAPTLEHIIPRSQGGWIAGNTAIAHYECNHAKGNRAARACEIMIGNLLAEAHSFHIDWCRSMDKAIRGWVVDEE